MSRQYFFKVFVLLQFILSSFYLLTQKNLFPFPPFEKITTRQGLSDNEVYQVMQDKQGFIWLLTGNGLTLLYHQTNRVGPSDRVIRAENKLRFIIKP